MQPRLTMLNIMGGLVFENTDGTELFRCGGCCLPSSQWKGYEEQVDLAALRQQKVPSVVDDFLDAIQEGRDPLVTGEQAAGVTRILEAAYESARANRVMRCDG